MNIISYFVTLVHAFLRPRHHHCGFFPPLLNKLHDTFDGNELHKNVQI